MPPVSSTLKGRQEEMNERKNVNKIRKFPQDYLSTMKGKKEGRKKRKKKEKEKRKKETNKQTQIFSSRVCLAVFFSFHCVSYTTYCILTIR